MTASITPINISGIQTTPKPIEEDVIVGKDILDLLTGSMYVDPLNVYREYIQNAADAIDLAKEAEFKFESEPSIQIFIDNQNRNIRIRDNGISIPSDKFLSRVVAIGASKKRGEKLRGFRGVGRLSGLGYCQTLIFRGRSEGDAKVTEVFWDGKKLKERYRDPDYNGTLTELVKEVTSVNRISPDNYPSRFFEVEMLKISRLKNDILLNEKVISNYISQVAPVPIEGKFGKKIQDFLGSHGIKPPFNIEIMDDSGPIKHRLKDTIAYAPSFEDIIKDIDFFEIKTTDGEITACGWVADHAYFGSIPKSLGLGGIRLRAGNIQVGTESILVDSFREPRFCGWVIGDIHILSTKILPNGRRDDFENSPAYTHLQGELAIIAKSASQKIRESSVKRNKLKFFDNKISSINTLTSFNSERKLPSIIKDVLYGISEKYVNDLYAELHKMGEGSSEYNKLFKEIIQVEKAAKTILSNKKKDNNYSEKYSNTLTKALNAIIINSKTTEAGLDLALEVFNVLEKETR